MVKKHPKWPDGPNYFTKTSVDSICIGLGECPSEKIISDKTKKDRWPDGPEYFTKTSVPSIVYGLNNPVFRYSANLMTDITNPTQKDL